MELVAVKNKYQVVIPKRVRQSVAIKIGDFMEAKAEKGKIILTPKFVMDKDVAEGLADYRAGRVYGPFDTHKEMVAFLHKAAKPNKRSKKK